MSARRGQEQLDRAGFGDAAACFEDAAARLAAGHPARGRLQQIALGCRADLAYTHVAAQRFGAAAAELDHVLQHDPGHVAARWLRARVCEREGAAAVALEHLARLDAAGVRAVRPSLLAAACHAALGDAAGFRSLLARAVAITRDRPCAPLTERAPDGAAGSIGVDWLARMRRSVARRPDAAGGRALLAELLLDAGGLEEADLHVAIARTLAPDDVEVMLLAGRSRLARGDAVAALALFGRAAARRPGYADTAAWIGLARFHAGAIADAIAALERSLALNRSYGGAWQSLAVVRFAAGDARGALAAARQMSLRHRQPPERPGAFHRALAEDPDDDAMRELQRAVTLHAGYPDLAAALALAHRRREAQAAAGRERPRTAFSTLPDRMQRVQTSTVFTWPWIRARTR